MIERSLVILKPDAVQRGLIGVIISRFENMGMKVVGMKMKWADRDFSKRHYKDHVEKAFYKGLEDFIVEGPVIAFVVEGIHAIETTRKLVGSTEPKQAAPGTIRGDFAHHSYAYSDKKGIAIKNLIHASDSVENAQKEIELWFDKEELHSYKTVHEKHVF
ncbi:nucleoside-diphosphate kinase [Candidatus Woesearchaeota archaeon]|nr:nucleoside-diphosphate kinase [Candidatus Woesearchaeota archaeon]